MVHEIQLHSFFSEGQSEVIILSVLCFCVYGLMFLKSLSQKRGIKIIFGYNTKSKEHYGLMMYHKNRLIKAYERVACQRKVRVIEFVQFLMYSYKKAALYLYTLTE